MKSKPITASLLKAAVAELNVLVEQGAEIPDVDYKVAKAYSVSRETLMNAYDAQFSRGSE